VLDRFLVPLAANSALDALAFLEELLDHMGGDEAACPNHENCFVCHVLNECAR
jgi:hypothetical protein